MRPSAFLQIVMVCLIHQGKQGGRTPGQQLQGEKQIIHLSQTT